MINWLIYSAVFVSWIVYVYLTFTAPLASTNSAYGLNEANLFFIRLTIAIPYLIIWMLGAYGYISLSGYVKTINDTPDGIAYSKFATGIKLLLFGLISASLISSFRSYNIHDPLELMSATTVSNFIYSIIPLIAYFLFFQAGSKLIEITKKKINFLTSNIVFTLIIVFLGIIVSQVIYSNPNRQEPFAPDVAATYYLSDFFIFLTVIIPLALGWLFGLLGAFRILKFQKEVPGSVYKASLKKFTFGASSLIISSIILQLLVALGTGRLLGIDLTSLLVVIYVFLILLAIGYGLIAVGAKNLIKIEQINIKK